MEENIIPKKPLLFGIFTSKPHRKWALLALASVLIATSLDRIELIIIKNLTDSIASEQIIFSQVWFWALLYPFLYLSAGLTWRISGFTGLRWFNNLRFTAYQVLYEYITLHSKDYFNSRFAGALTNKMGNAVDGTESVYMNFLWRFLPLTFGMVWYVVLAWSGNPILGIIIFVWSSIFIFLNILFARKLQPKSYEFAKSTSNLKGRIVDSIANISLVHESAYLTGERRYINKFINNQRSRGLAEWQFSEWVLLTNNLLIFVFICLMIIASIYLFQIEMISVGVVIMIIALIVQLVGHLIFLGNEIKNTTKYYGQASEGLEEILASHIIKDKKGAKNVYIKNGDIVFRSIDFKYEHSYIYKNFSLSITKGEKIGLVGRSGAGKTTLVSLLLRHFDIQKGEIEIDGHNISDIKLESVRRAISFVPQDTTLFHRTIKENIQYASPDSNFSEVKLAAKHAQIHDFIENLPKGYHTLVGERGIKLSGGQRQRIAIARAFLKNAPILILDEATSSLDSESEQAIQASLEQLIKSKTVIAIAHRLSTLKRMNRIVIIEEGNIVEDGKPEDLLQKEGGIFKNMWEHQVKGFIIDE